MHPRLIHYSLIISLLIHISAIGAFSLKRSGKLFQKPMKQIEVTYTNIKQNEQKKKFLKYQQTNIVKETKLKKEIKALRQEQKVLPYAAKEIRDLSKIFEPLKNGAKKSSSVGISDQNKKAFVSIHKPVKITNPDYLNYYDIIGDKIKKRANYYLKSANTEQGIVYVSFILSSAGLLEIIKIKEAQTSASSFLQEVALKSVKDCEPFPPFPKGFDYPSVPFKISISMSVN